jgi:hypothetical protein
MRFQNIMINNKFRNVLINHYFNKIESSLKAIFNEFDLLCCRILEFIIESVKRVYIFIRQSLVTTHHCTYGHVAGCT